MSYKNKKTGEIVPGTGRGTEPRRGIVINSPTAREAERIAQRADFERRYGAPGSRKSAADILFSGDDD